MKKSNIKVKCDNCGKMIHLIPYQIKNFKHHFCDLKCKGEFFSGNKNPFFNKFHSSQTKKILRDKALIRFELNGHPLKNKRIKESSKIKMSEAKKGKYLGKNNPNWKGGTSKREFEEVFGYTISQWNELTTKIRKRDSYICQYCGDSNSYIIHHIFPKRIRLDNHPDNLITLCNKCHPMIENLTQEYLNLDLNPIQIFYEKWSGLEHKSKIVCFNNRIHI